MAAKKPKRKAPQTWEFSKIILMLVMAAFFVAVGVGVYLSIVDHMQFSTLAVLVGGPAAVAIAFYAWKSKCENIQKYKKDDPTVNFDPGNVQS